MSGRALRMSWLCGVICLLGLVAAFSPMSGDLWTAWQTDEYSHGLLIPFLALLLGAHRLHKKPLPPVASFLGLPLMLLGYAGLMIGSLAAFQAAAHYGFLLCLIGVTLAFAGPRITRRLIPAFVYLWFAIPLPHLFQAGLSQQLQLISSTLGVWVLQLVGIPVYQEGNVIDLGAYRLQVVDACSGLRYLFPLISFGYLAACLLEGPRWKRLLIFFSAIPITIVMNSLRIGVIGVTVAFWGAEMAEGLLHDLEGWVVFAMCAGILLLEIHLIAPIGRRSRFRLEYFSWPSGRLLSRPIAPSKPMLAATALCAFAAVWFGSGKGFERQEIIPPAPALASFPLELDTWKGKLGDLPPDVLESLQLSDYWLADYRRESAPPVNLYIAYYASQHIGSSTHSPSHCIPAGGWEVKSSGAYDFTPSGGQPMTVTRMLIRKGNLGQLVYFWFSERGRTHIQTTYAKWYLLQDSVNLGRTDGSLIRVSTPVTDNDEASADARLQSFISLAQPEISRILPGRDIPKP